MSPFKRKMKLRRLLIDCPIGYSAKEISDKLKTHPKTVVRDLKDLKELGGLRVMREPGCPELYYYSVELEIEVNKKGAKREDVKIRMPGKKYKKKEEKSQLMMF